MSSAWFGMNPFVGVMMAGPGGPRTCCDASGQQGRQSGSVRASQQLTKGVQRTEHGASWATSAAAILPYSNIYIYENDNSILVQRQ